MASGTTTGTTIGNMDASATKQQQPFTRPEKPDEDAFKKGLVELVKLHAAAQEKFKAAAGKLYATPNNKNSPAAQRAAELRTELAEIRQKQSGFKNSRQSLQEKLTINMERIKAKIAESKAQRAKVPFKSVDDIDREIERKKHEVDSASLRLVDEKKALADISQMNRMKKSFATFDDSDKQIAALKKEQAELKKQLDNPEARALGERYTKLQKELDALNGTRDDAYKLAATLRVEKDKLKAEADKAWIALRAYKDGHYERVRAYRAYDQEAWRLRREKQRSEQAAWDAKKRKEAAQIKLDEAGAPAYGAEISTAEGLIRYFDPSAVAAKEQAAPSKFAASAQRTVDDGAFTGMRIAKKDDEDYFAGSGGKKNKKASKKAAPPSAEKMNLNLGLIEDFTKVGIDPPTSWADVPNVVETIKQKLAKWKAEQDDKTKENVAKAQKEIDRLGAEALKAEALKAAAAASPASSTGRTTPESKTSRRNSGKSSPRRDNGTKTSPKQRNAAGSPPAKPKQLADSTEKPSAAKTATPVAAAA